MASIILCAKEKGNTRKLCDAIAAQEGWTLHRITAGDDTDVSGYDRVVVASGVYLGAPHAGLLAFLKDLPDDRKPARVAVLLTWLGRGESDRDAFDRISAACEPRGIRVSAEYRSVLGQSFGVIHAGHPTGDEIDGCVAWALKLPNRQ